MDDGRGWLRMVRRCALALLTGLLLAGCQGDDGSQGPPGPRGEVGPPGEAAPPPPLETQLTRHDDLPGLDVTIVSVAGGTGPGGNLAPGDTVSVRFTLATDAGDSVAADDLDTGEIVLSGPARNYQPVLALRQDVPTAAKANDDGSYTYTFTTAIPDTYPAPAHDSPAFGATDGELAGEALQDGTYTVALMVAKRYEVEGRAVDDVGTATADALLGAADTVSPRAVVSDATCGRCHGRVRYHGTREGVRTCVLCHTAGAEDGNDAGVAGGTPGRTIAFGVMIHKLHNGAHLPSVLGVGTDGTGARDYTVTPEPYRLQDGDGTLHDYTTLAWPVWPNASAPLPRDAGYSALTASAQNAEDAIRYGVATCAVCHGDPDGSGLGAAPAQSDLAYANPSRATCGACHDDVDWTAPYTANGQTMNPQADDSACATCHPASGDALAVQEGHLHPLRDPAVNPGLNVAIDAVSEAGTHDGDGTLDVGEAVAVTFTVQDDSGSAVTPDRLEAWLSGPVDNPNPLASVLILASELPASQPYTVTLPETVPLEVVGTATSGSDMFTTNRAPHWNGGARPATVYERTATGAATTLSAAASAKQTWVDGNTTGFAAGDDVLLDQGNAGEEYARVAAVDGTRLWLDDPLRNDHTSGTTLAVVSLVEKTSGTDYTLDPAAGTVTTVAGQFTAGNPVLVSYTADFVVPATYDPPPHDSPDVGQETGEWTGLPILDGTYTLTLNAGRKYTVNAHGETTTYNRGTSAAAQVVVGNPTGATSPVEVADAGCAACHTELRYHGGWRGGLASCLACHRLRGAEDFSRRAAGLLPSATPGVSIGFRRLVHKLHRGSALTDAASYVVAGYAGHEVAWTDVVYPAWPGGTKGCTTCHTADGESWRDPVYGTHPAATVPPAPWTEACTSCHDTAAAGAHAALNTASGAEACRVCHGPGSAEAVEVMHTVR